MVDMTNDVTRFEALFSDRFTEKDEKYMELKSKPLPNPVVLHPWKAQRKVWNKRWDYSTRRNQDERSHTDGSRDSHRDHRRGEGNSRSNYRDRSRDRDRYEESRDRSRDKKYEQSQKAYSKR